MKKFEHLNFEHRKIINNQITTQKATAVKIAELLGCDPTTVSKEIKRNRFASKQVAKNTGDPICKKTLIYNYINKGILTTSKIDLPYATTYKKRKKSNKKYEYNENNKIDRSNRTFIDYLAYLQAHPNVFVIQMDFLGSIKTDSKSILTLIIPNLHFVYLSIIHKPNSKKVVNFLMIFKTRLELITLRKLFQLS
ncbi:MAG: helix-turn-helix domain-containing protein [Eubacteriales bacterium]|nr:helix-turn-helix domain-containing protein [Eubacteriales bacterium]MDY3332628.1 helix-turn-helix domain-containing protein [Gallibacter sp.]